MNTKWFKFRVGDMVLPTSDCKRSIYFNREIKYNSLKVTEVKNRNGMSDLLTLSGDWNGDPLSHIDSLWLIPDKQLARVLYQ
jgi:hypothetical protein